MIDLIYGLIKNRFVKYGISGSIGLVVHMLVLWLLTDIAHCWYILSAIVAIIVAALNNYILNHYWTFSDRKQSVGNMFVGYFKYLLSRGFTEGLYLILLYLAVDIVGLHYLSSAAIIQILTAVLGYVIVSRWIWRKHSDLESKYVFDLNRYY